MTAIAPAPINMNNALLKIGTDNYEKSVSSALLSPSPAVSKFKGIDGSTTKVAGMTDWTLKLTYAQDWVTAASLSQYLLTNAGTTKSIDLTTSTGAKKATVLVLIVPGDMGGDVDSTTLATVTLEVIGQPTLV